MGQPRTIPNTLNGLVVAAQLLIVSGCIASCFWNSGWQWVVVGALFVVVMNSVYFAIHEAEHGVLFSNPAINHLAGTILALFMPAPYTLIRRVHLGHHIYNRSDEEVFDVYFENEPAWWKKLQFFGLLTGGFWLTMVIGNVALALLPMRWIVRAMQVDRPSATAMKYVHRHGDWQIRAEAWLLIAFHSTIAWCLGPRALGYGLMYFAFGTSWSTLQYVHHYGTCRDVLRGAKNLRYGKILDLLWMHHGWHLTHHLHPTVSWLHLPNLAESHEQPTESLVAAYLKMWRGPILTSIHVKNQYEGNVGQD
jgi:fatty acid desaturase